eukprot:11916430-Alexandrium_andersonii.AAC.1
MAHGLWIRLPRPTCLPLPSRRSESSLTRSPMSTPRSRGRADDDYDFLVLRTVGGTLRGPMVVW